MYIQGSRQYEYHVKTYGHPTKFGFKDVIPTWKADKFDPDHLLQLYKKAGAKYFCSSMGVHHDGFDLWKSVHQPRWNVVAAGPKIDVVGLFKKAAAKHGLRFAVSEHLAPSYHWFSPSHTTDKTGPLAGVPYDGADPAFADLYHELPADYPYGKPMNDRQAPDPWKLHYFKRIKDLVDNYQPDLLYTDGDIFFEEYGLGLVANLYNISAKRHGGRVEAVYTSKLPSDCTTGTCVLDWERGVAAGIPPNPWQTDTCVGDWHYNKDAKYKSPKRVIDMLVDIVSRNGNLMLNFPLPNSGQLDDRELKILDEIAQWMAINSEGIYASRPWKTFGEGPVASAPLPSGRGARFNEMGRRDLTAEEIRFTTKGSNLYAFVMGWPEKEAVIKALSTSGGAAPFKVRNVELLGFKGKMKWTQDEKGLTVEMPQRKPSDHAIALKVFRRLVNAPPVLKVLRSIRRLQQMKRLSIFAVAVLAGWNCFAESKKTSKDSKAAARRELAPAPVAAANAPAVPAHPSPYNIPGAQFPRIEADSRVTFQFKAPDAKKVQVALVTPGQNSLQPLPFDMVKGDDGVWTYTSAPQSPGYHNYWMLEELSFDVDGLSMTLLPRAGWPKPPAFHSVDTDLFGAAAGDSRSPGPFADVEKGFRQRNVDPRQR